MKQVQMTENKTVDYVGINLESLRINTILNFDLYLVQAGEFILYRASSQPFTEKNRTNLLENNIRDLFVSQDSVGEYQKYIESNLRTIVDDPSIEEAAKARIIYNSATLLVQDILAKPTMKKNIERSKKFVESTISYILRGQEAFFSLLRMMSFDYYTYTHSVNVCTFAVALAKFVGIDNNYDLQKIGTGALLHDVGKTRIDDAILNKRGRLTEEEMDLVRNHPEWGAEIIHETDIVPEEVYFPILQHHEREDGSGYPEGMHGFRIHDFSKIVAIADVFDAMTTERVYRSALDSFPALKEMFKVKDTFNRHYLESFTRMLGPFK